MASDHIGAIAQISISLVLLAIKTTPSLGMKIPDSSPEARAGRGIITDRQDGLGNG